MRSFFFFKAKDGIGEKLVTGVQTCALPICRAARSRPAEGQRGNGQHGKGQDRPARSPDPREQRTVFERVVYREPPFMQLWLRALHSFHAACQRDETLRDDQEMPEDADFNGVVRVFGRAAWAPAYRQVREIGQRSWRRAPRRSERDGD